LKSREEMAASRSSPRDRDARTFEMQRQARFGSSAARLPPRTEHARRLPRRLVVDGAKQRTAIAIADVEEASTTSGASPHGLPGLLSCRSRGWQGQRHPVGPDEKRPGRSPATPGISRRPDPVRPGVRGFSIRARGCRLRIDSTSVPARSSILRQKYGKMRRRCSSDDQGKAHPRLCGVLGYTDGWRPVAKMFPRSLLERPSLRTVRALQGSNGYAYTKPQRCEGAPGGERLTSRPRRRAQARRLAVRRRARCRVSSDVNRSSTSLAATADQATSSPSTRCTDREVGLLKVDILGW